MRINRRSGMLETENPPAPCGLTDSAEPKMLDEALGSLGFTDTTSNVAGVAGDCDCANALVRQMPQARTTQTTRSLFIGSVLLSRSCEGAVAEVSRRQGALHRILGVHRAGVLQLDRCPLHRGRDDELDGLTFHGAGEIGLPHQLRGILAGEFLAVLLEGQRRIAFASRRLDGEDPHAGHVHFVRLTLAAKLRERRWPGRRHANAADEERRRECRQLSGCLRHRSLHCSSAETPLDGLSTLFRRETRWQNLRTPMCQKYPIAATISREWRNATPRWPAHSALRSSGWPAATSAILRRAATSCRRFTARCGGASPATTAAARCARGSIASPTTRRSRAWSARARPRRR